MDALADYLRIAENVTDRPRDLRWSEAGDAILQGDGETFILAAQLAPFLEGLGSRGGPPVQFTAVLRLLVLLGFGRRLGDIGSLPAQADADTADVAALPRHFHETGWPIRNAGASLIALCPDLPRHLGPADVTQVCQWLRSPALMAELVGRLGHDDVCFSLTDLAELKNHVRERLATLTAAELRHWLKHGCPPPAGGGDDLAKAVPPPPRTLAGALAELARRPRLASAVPFVAQMVSALTLPPRRLAHNQLPTGGYADVTTRGRPEQILPAQLALDGVEFVRRFSQNELLYYRREEPNTSAREELVLLLDQGVRTWGVVRLVLAAAALALGRRAERGKLSLRLAATSNDGRLLDPLEASADELAEAVEASDLSPHPGLALERVLEEVAAAKDGLTRDVVMLTQRRSLAEEDVRAAARRVPPGVRLFALAVEESGEAELCEVRRGVPVRVRQFRVDLSAGRTPAEPPRLPTEGPRPWTGDVEPIGYPFLVGPRGRPGAEHHFDFDHAAGWLLESGRDGTLHARRLDGAGAEVLPRGLYRGHVLRKVDEVIGVRGGFVVTGRLPAGVAVFHYDFDRRRCWAFLLGEWIPAPWRWAYFPDLHTLATTNGRSRLALDLSVPGPARRDPLPGTTSDDLPGNWLQDVKPEAWTTPQALQFGRPDGQGRGVSLHLDPATGGLTLREGAAVTAHFVPHRDGKPFLLPSQLDGAWLHHGVLVLRLRQPNGLQRTLHLFRLPDGRPLGEFAVSMRDESRFKVSRGGRYYARQVSRGALEVRDLESGRPLPEPFPSAERDTLPEVVLGRDWLGFLLGRRTHLVRWRGGRLHCTTHGDAPERTAWRWASDQKNGFTGARTAALPAPFRYDQGRWVAGVEGSLLLGLDVHGQVMLLDRNGEPVAAFIVKRGTVAGWLPDGTRFGPPAVTGGPSSPGAADVFGRALLAACQRGEGVPT